MKILIVGMGRMGGSIVSRLAEVKDYTLIAVDPIFKKQDNVDKVSPNIECYSHIDLLDPNDHHFDVVLLAFKPQMFSMLAQQLFNFINDTTLVISIMAGIELKTMRRFLRNRGKPVRIMPNIAALVGHSTTVCYAENDVSTQEKNVIDEIFLCIGSVTWLQKEEDIHTVTALSGSGPAYFYAFCETLTHVAEEMGLSDEIAKTLVMNTFIGAAKLLEQEKNPTKLRKAVTSQGGTTEAALDVLLQSEGLPNMSRLTVTAAINRSKILAQSD